MANPLRPAIACIVNHDVEAAMDRTIVRRRRYVCLTILLVAGVTTYIVTVKVQPMEEPFKVGAEIIEEGTWAGFDTAVITSRLGPPTTSFATYVQVGRKKPQSLPPGPYLTWRYDCGGGTLYVWFHAVGDRFVSFDSLWFDRGVEL
jgi:hypothetical protein